MADYVECSECGTRLKSENETSHMRKVHPNAAFFARPRAGPRPPRQSFYVTNRTKKALFATAVAIVFIVAGVILLRNMGQATPIDTGATPIRVSMSGFEPSTITVKAGTSLKIDLINLDSQYHPDGGGWHDFVVEAFRMNVSVEPMGQKVFTVPTSTPGTYSWYCDICCGGKDNPSMIGTIRVTA